MQNFTKNAGNLSIDLQDFSTRFLLTLNEYNPRIENAPSYFIDLPIKSYLELGSIISSLIKISTTVISFYQTEKLNDPELLMDSMKALLLAEKLIPFDELKGLDYLKNLAELSEIKKEE